MTALKIHQHYHLEVGVRPINPVKLVGNLVRYAPITPVDPHLSQVQVLGSEPIYVELMTQVQITHLFPLTTTFH